MSPQQSVFVRCNFPVEFFGFLFGTSRLFLTISQFILFGLVQIPQVYGFDAYLYGLISVELVTLSFPVVLIYRKLKSL